MRRDEGGGGFWVSPKQRGICDGTQLVARASWGLSSRYKTFVDQYHILDDDAS